MRQAKAEFSVQISPKRPKTHARLSKQFDAQAATFFAKVNLQSQLIQNKTQQIKADLDNRCLNIELLNGHMQHQQQKFQIKPKIHELKLPEDDGQLTVLLQALQSIRHAIQQRLVLLRTHIDSKEILEDILAMFY